MATKLKIPMPMLLDVVPVCLYVMSLQNLFVMPPFAEIWRTKDIGIMFQVEYRRAHIDQLSHAKMGGMHCVHTKLLLSVDYLLTGMNLPVTNQKEWFVKVHLVNK